MKKKMHTGVRAYGLHEDVHLCTEGAEGVQLSSAQIASHRRRKGTLISVPRTVPSVQQVPNVRCLSNEFIYVLLYKHIVPHIPHPDPFLAPAQLRISKETDS